MPIMFFPAISAPDPVDWISYVPVVFRRVVPSNKGIVEQNPPSFWWSGYQSINKNTSFTVSLWANVTSIDNVTPQWTFTTKLNYLNIPFTLPLGTNYLWQVTRVNVSAGTSIPSALLINRTVYSCSLRGSNDCHRRYEEYGSSANFLEGHGT